MSFLEYANEIVFILCGLLGGVAHYLKKYMRKETAVPVWDWFGRSNLPATIYTFLVFLFAMIGSIASGVINDDMSIWITMYIGFVTGFALDAGFNSDGQRLNPVVGGINNPRGGIGSQPGINGLPPVDPNNCPPMPNVREPRRGGGLTDLRPGKREE